MTRLEQPPPSASAPALAAAYVGYRWPGLSAALRLPTGEHTVLDAGGGAGQALAEAVLSDRLGHAPCSDVLDAFHAEWVRPFTRGEFAWPVEAVDEWLATATAGAATDCSPAPLDRALEITRRVLGVPLAHHPISATTPIPPGAH